MKKVQGLNLDPLGLTWEELFKVLRSLSPGAYELETMDHKKFNHSWNIQYLKILPVDPEDSFKFFVFLIYCMQA